MSIISKHYNNTIIFPLTITTLPKNPWACSQECSQYPRALPLNITITLLPTHLPLQLCPKALSKLWACPQECNQYPRVETTKVAYFNSITSKHYNNTVTFPLTITTLPKNPFSPPDLPSRVHPISPDSDNQRALP